MNWATFQTAIASWAASATGIAAANVRWAGQNAPRPAYPFVVLNIIAESQLGQDEIRYTEDEDAGELVPTICGNRLFTVSVQVHALPPPEGTLATARTAISAARASLKAEGTLLAFHTAGIAVVGAEATQALQEEVEGRSISRAMMDVRFAAAENLTDSNVDYIETTELTGTLDGETVVDGETFGVGV